MKMKAVIFDLDGTLLNTIDTITYYSNKALSKFGFATATADEFKYFVGNGAVKLIERAPKAASGQARILKTSIPIITRYTTPSRFT